VQRTMLAAPVVVSEEQGQGRLVIAPSLAERTGEASHAFGEVANAAVHAFDVAGANLVAGGATRDGRALHAYYLCGRVFALLFLAGPAEYLHHLAIVDPLPQVPRYGVLVGSEPIGRELEPARRGDVQLAAERIGVFHRATARVERDQELCMAFDGREAVGIAATADIVLTGGSGLLAEDVAPDFVNLNVIDGDALDLFGHERFAALANQQQQVGDGRLAGVRDALDGADRHTLAQHFDDLGRTVEANTQPAQDFG
jgi:hypothetical protein